MVKNCSTHTQTQLNKTAQLRENLSVSVCLCTSGGEWRLKYERAIRDTEFTKKKLQQEMDDKLETEQQNKRHLERKVSTALQIHTHGAHTLVLPNRLHTQCEMYLNSNSITIIV